MAVLLCLPHSFHRHTWYTYSDKFTHSSLQRGLLTILGHWRLLLATTVTMCCSVLLFEGVPVAKVLKVVEVWTQHNITQDEQKLVKRKRRRRAIGSRALCWLLGATTEEISAYGKTLKLCFLCACMSAFRLAKDSTARLQLCKDTWPIFRPFQAPPRLIKEFLFSI